jgi:hypothetical protein
MGAYVDQTRNSYFIPDFDESDEGEIGALIGSLPEDWIDEEEWPFSDDEVS